MTCRRILTILAVEDLGRAVRFYEAAFGWPRVVDASGYALGRLRAAGATELSALTARDWGHEVAYFADPDGFVLAVARPMNPGVGS